MVFFFFFFFFSSNFINAQPPSLFGGAGSGPQVAFDLGGSLCKVAVLEPHGATEDDAARRMLRFFTESERRSTYSADSDGGDSAAADDSAAPGGQQRARGESVHERYPLLSMDLPTGTLHFAKLDSREMPAALALLERERINLRVPLRVTGGGAWKHAALLGRALGVDPVRFDELRCLLSGLNFALAHAEEECFYYPDPSRVDRLGIFDFSIFCLSFFFFFFFF
jgi:hypothetical protein